MHTRRTFLAGTLLAPPLAAFPVPWRPEIFAPSLALSDELPPLPEGALRRLGSRRLRVSGSISRLSFSACGKYIIAAERNEIRGWDVRTGALELAMGYPKSHDLKSGRITHDRCIVALGTHNTSNTYDIVRIPFPGRAVDSWSTGMRGHTNSVFTSDGRRVAVQHEKQIRVIDANKGDVWTETYDVDNDRECEMAFAANESRLVLVFPKSLMILDAATGKSIATKDTSGFRGLSTASRGSAICARLGQTHHIWDARDGASIATLERGDGETFTGFSPDGRTAYFSCDDRMEIVDIATKKTKTSYVFDANRKPVLSPNGDILAVEAEDAVVLFDAATGVPLKLAADPPGLPTKLFFNGREQMIGQLTHFGGWAKFNLKTNTCTVWRGDGMPIGISADGRVAVSFSDGNFRIRDANRNEEPLRIKHESNRSVPLADVTASGRLVATTAKGIRIREARQPDVELEGLARREVADALSVVETTAAVLVPISSDHTETSVHVVEVYSLVERRRLSAFRVGQHAGGVVLSPDGERVAVSSRAWRSGKRTRSMQYQVQVFDTANGRLLFTSPGWGNESSKFAFSACGRLLAVGFDSTIQVFEIASGSKRLAFTPPGGILSLAFAPAGEMLATACIGGPLLLWDMRATFKSSPAKPDVAKLTEWLADKDAATAFETIRMVAAWPDLCFPVLAQALPPVKAPDPAKIRAAIADLGSEIYRERDAASAALIAIGELAAADLEATRATTENSEVRERIDGILAHFGTSPTDLLVLRSVEAAEWAASKDVLKTWARGAAAATLTKAATAALTRLA